MYALYGPRLGVDGMDDSGLTTPHVPALQPGVMGNAGAGADRDFLPGERCDAPGAVDRQANLVWRDPGSPGGPELADLASRVDAGIVAPYGPRLDPAGTPSTGTRSRRNSLLSSRRQ
jgi:hypothetical protein